MKELSIEEKSKAYDEAINRMKHYVVDKYGCSRIKVADVFPELMENEDERIRKALLKTFRNFDPNGTFWTKTLQIDKERVVAWLEKQGEHANFRNKIQIGDKVTRNEDGVLVNLSQLKRVAKKDEKQGEQKDILEDAILDSNEDGLIAETIRYKNEKKPAEWSEEDERFLNVATNILNASKVYTKSPDKYEDTINWLKSLRPNHWKPSDEQMDALHYVANFDYGGHKATLVSLYEQLKKLREK